MAQDRILFQSGETSLSYQSWRASRYREYQLSQLIAGKCRRWDNFASSAQKTLTIRSVFWVTGSEKSPPGGETAPMTETDPDAPFKVSTRPARS